MSKEQLEKDLCQNGFCSTERRAHCRLSANSYCWDVEIIAEKLYNAGYRKQSEWISVEERLPEDVYGKDRRKITVLVCTEGRKVSTATRQRRAEFDSTKLEWVELDTLEWSKRKRVTHWMPLPKVPKMKGGAE